MFNVDFTNTNIPTSELAPITAAIATIESVVVGDLTPVFVGEGNTEGDCDIPTLVDDLWVCLYYEPNLPNNILGRAGPFGFRFASDADANLPVLGIVELSPDLPNQNDAAALTQFVVVRVQCLLKHYLSRLMDI